MKQQGSWNTAPWKPLAEICHVQHSLTSSLSVGPCPPAPGYSVNCVDLSTDSRSFSSLPIQKEHNILHHVLCGDVLYRQCWLTVAMVILCIKCDVPIGHISLPSFVWKQNLWHNFCRFFTGQTPLLSTSQQYHIKLPHWKMQLQNFQVKYYKWLQIC